jgi:photosystem II stability/assembly factor-like uncharacterized protein
LRIFAHGVRGIPCAACLMIYLNYRRAIILFCLFILVAAIGFAWWAMPATTPARAQTPDVHKLMMPNEHFYFQRAYPDFDMPVSVVQNALRQAQNQAAAKQAGEGFDADWLIEGPSNIGGRINAIAPHPTNADIIYVGSSRGGIHKTTDGGTTWQAIFDEPLFNSIGDITISPHDANTIYVGTGDVNISSFFSVGDGVYRSTDAGATWQNIGLNNVGIISKVIIDPSNANRIFVGAMGNPLVRDEHRGLYRSDDGGATWQKVLYIDDDAGIIDLVIDHNQPNILYAASWNRIRNLQETITHEQDSRIWKTSDGGNTWQILSNGLPDHQQSRIGLAMADQNTNRLAAVYVDSTETLLGVFVSNDGGAAWEQTANADAFGGDPLGGFGWYFGKIAFDPADDQSLFVLGVDMFQSLDGGYSWELATPIWFTYEVHADKHALEFDAEGGILLGTDGGVYRSTDGATTWEDIEFIPNTQFYRVAVNPHIPNMYCGGAQDNGTTMGNADMIDNWPRLFGGDGFQAVFHPDLPDLWYVETQWGNISYTQDNGNNFDSADDGINPSDRRNWDMPYMMSSHSEHSLLAGTYRMYRSNSNNPPNYTAISDDLTDGNIYGDRFHNISTIDQSVLTPDYYYVGTSDGNVWRSLNGGDAWENINGTLPDRYVTAVKASPHALNTVYVSISGYKGNGIEPHLFRSTDNGNNWTAIGDDLPPVAVNDILVLPEDTTDQILIAATDAGVYLTADGGSTWVRLGGNMPIFSIFDIDYDVRNHKLVAATFARSIMSFDLSQVIDFESGNASVGIKPHSTATAVLHAHYQPDSRTLQLAFRSPDEQSAPNTAQINVLNIGGAVAAHNTWQSPYTREAQLDLPALPSGLYLAHVTTDKGKSYVQRIIVP